MTATLEHIAEEMDAQNYKPGIDVLRKERDELRALLMEAIAYVQEAAQQAAMRGRTNDYATNLCKRIKDATNNDALLAAVRVGKV